MFVAGYTFYVLNNAFISHLGFQAPDSTPDWRADQVSPVARSRNDHTQRALFE
jgi:hypothetical protein